MTRAVEEVDEAIRHLRALILAGERYRQVLAERLHLGVTETQAISYLTVKGDRGQTDLATDLGITSGSSTALVDRLERQGIAERYADPSDRRRVFVRLTPKARAVVQTSHDWLLVGLQGVPDEDFAVVSAALRSIAERLHEQSERVSRGEEPLLPEGPGPDAR